MEKWYEKFRSIGTEPLICTFNNVIGGYGKKWMYEKNDWSDGKHA